MLKKAFFNKKESENTLFNKFKLKLEKIPIGLAGVGLGMGGLGSVWTIFLTNKVGGNAALLSIIQYFCISVTFIFFCIIALRSTFAKKTITKEIRDPLLSSFLPTIAMGLMLIGGFVAQISKIAFGSRDLINAFTIIGAIIWYGAVLLQFILLLLFIFHIIRNHNFKKDIAYASWFVPPIGIITACTVAGNFSSQIIPSILFQFIWYFGFSFYMLMLPYILYKIVFLENAPKEKLASLAIFGAPANLSLTGFLDVFTRVGGNEPSYYSENFLNIMMIFLVIFSIATTLFIYVSFFKIFQTKFNASFAALTFPLAIGANGMWSSYVYLNFFDTTETFVISLKMFVEIIAYIELIIATIVISYVFFRFCLGLFRLFYQRPNIKSCIVA